jgi:signal transduction histidine kinase/ligand-binding sensor domain-containing protein/DNA-binding response OmpR family regulator
MKLLRTNRTTWIVISIFCNLTILLGQDELPLQYKFDRLAEVQNLTNNVINSIDQDTLGFIWVGTDDGLFRFDGANFESFRRRSGNKGLPNNTINKVFVDRSNRVWALTNYGFGIYDYNTDSIVGYEPKDVGVNVKSFNSAIEDSQGNIYLGTSGSGVIKYSTEQKFEKFNPLNNLPIDLSSLEVSNIEILNNTLWIGTWRNGVIRIDLKSGYVHPIKLESIRDEQPYIYDLSWDENGTIWVGTEDGFQIIEDQLNAQKIEANIKDEVLAIYNGEDGDVWFGTRSSGLLLKTVNQNGFTQFKPGNDEYSVSHRTISEIFHDKAGSMWLGTHNKGINVFNPKGERITIIKPELNDAVLPNNNASVWGLSQHGQDELWMGTDGSGLFHFNPKERKMVLTASSNHGIKISDDAILSITEIENNKLLLGTYAGGLNILNLNNNQVTVLDNTKGIVSNDIRAVYQDLNKKNWIGTNRGGLYEINIEKGTSEVIEETVHLDIRSISQFPNDPGSLWLATYGNGLVKYTIDSGLVEEYNWNSLDSDFIPIALCLAHAKGKLWIGTKESGLLSFSTETNKFELINESNGLLNNTVRSLVLFENHLWLSSNMGISAIDLNTKRIKNFDGSDGLATTQFNDGSAIVFKNKYLVFGGINGMIIFNPNQLLTEKKLPKVTFTGLELDNKSIHPSKENNHLSTSISIANELRFGPNEDVFTIHFNVLNFISSGGSWHYEYRLKGFDKSWNYESNVSEATYRNLPSGNYTFEVRAVDTANETLGPISSLDLRISPPWYKTIYAFMVFSLIILIFIYFLYKYNTDRAEIKQSLVFEQKLRQKEHDTMQEKIRFYTNFSHEMRTPITLISGPVNDLLRNESIPAINKKSLRLIKRNSNTLLKLINRLLEFRKLETENTILNIGHHNLTVLAQEEAESFSYLAKDQDIKFGFYCETDLHAWIDIEKFQIIINNLLSNALKYAEKDTKVTFRVRHESPSLIIEVEDEGRGINKSEFELIFTPFYQAKNTIGSGGTGIGLALCKSFIELHSGSIEVSSELGAGSTFTISFPDGKDHLEQQNHVRFIEVQKGEIDESIEPQINIDDAKEITENEKVLLVAEDNADIRNYISSLFESSFKVFQAKDGISALELAQEIIPDIIISDIMMPKLDGLRFCKEIKGNVATSHVPVILLTAKATNETKVDGYGAGADGYITKPFDSNVLIARVNNLLQSREHLRGLHESGQWMENKDVPSSEIEFVLKVESVVLEMVPKGELNVIQLCRELGFSRTSLYRKIKSLTGQSIKQFIRSIKLKKAAELLATEDMAVSEVAFSLDFTDLKYFRTCFKKQYGKLPSEYQNEMKVKEPVSQEDIRKALNI